MLDLSRYAHEEFSDQIAQDGFFLTFAESTTQGIVITDPHLPDNPLVFVNPSFVEMTGYDPSEIIGRNCRFLQGEETDEKSVKLIREHIDSREPLQIRLKNYRKNGDAFWNELNMAPILDETGEVRYFLAIQKDVTAQEEVREIQQDFSALMLHQLRTPISVISYSIDVIDPQKTSLTADAQEYLQHISNNSRRMNQIINDITRLAEIDPALSPTKPQLQMSEFDLNDLLRSVIESLVVIREKHDVDVDFKAIDGGVTIRGDRDLLHQAYYNIILNAIQYSRHENPKPVVVSIEASDAGTVVRVQDHGIGIPEKDQPKIMQRRFRAENAEPHKSHGTGLGLFFARRIVELHDGEISFTSTQGEGTTFTIAL